MNKYSYHTLLIMLFLAITVPVSYAGQCREHIETLSAATLAKEYNKPESWIVANHKTNLWAKNNKEGKGKVVGKLLPGSRALIVDRDTDGYKVKSPYDGSTGWISNIQVSHTLFQDAKTFEKCEP